MAWLSFFFINIFNFTYLKGRVFFQLPIDYNLDSFKGEGYKYF